MGPGLRLGRGSPAICAVLALVALSLPPAAFGLTGSQSFTAAGEHAFVVPAGVTSVRALLVGGNGAAGPGGAPGGTPATATATLSVTPGEALDAEVAGDGQLATAGVDGGFGGSGGGGFGGEVITILGGVPDAGGGGGASDVRTCSIAASGCDSPASRLVVAGGGGGGGGPGGDGTIPIPAGPGGPADISGFAGGGDGTPSDITGSGGGRGTAASGGAAGDGANAGTLGTGGDGAPGIFTGTAGGGGGGGIFGAGSSPVPVSATFSGLSPATTFTVTLLAASPAGQASGSPVTFATPGHGSGSPPPSGNHPVAPAISHLHVAPTVHRTVAKHKRPPVTISLRLSARASLTFTFAHVLQGRRSHHGCVLTHTPPPRASRCVLRYVAVPGRLTVAGVSGADQVRYSGTLDGGKRLAPGAYRLTVVAVGSAGTSAPQQATFTLVK